MSVMYTGSYRSVDALLHRFSSVNTVEEDDHP